MGGLGSTEGVLAPSMRGSAGGGLAPMAGQPYV